MTASLDTPRAAAYAPRVRRLRALALAPTLALAACAAVRSTALPATGVRLAPHRGRVAVSLTRDPAAGVELGRVEATTYSTVDDLVPEFVERVAGLGGDYARIDELGTRYEWQWRPVTSTYNCGSFRFPMTCARTYMVQEEVATLRAVGRAFRTAGAR